MIYFFSMIRLHHYIYKLQETLMRGHPHLTCQIFIRKTGSLALNKIPHSITVLDNWSTTIETWHVDIITDFNITQEHNSDASTLIEGLQINLK